VKKTAIVSPMMRHIGLAGTVIVITLLFAHPLQADAEVAADCDPQTMTCPDAAAVPGDAYTTPEPGRPGDQSLFAFLDTPQALIGSGLNGFARAIDAFFAAEKLSYEKSGSYIRLTMDAASFARDDSGFFTSVRARLKLPRTSEKYKLIIENTPEQRRDAPDNVVQESLLEAADRQDYFAGIQAVGGSRERWRYRSGIGVRLGSPLESYLRWGSWRTFPFDLSALRVEATVYRYSHDGMRYITSAEYSYRMQADLLFRSLTLADWREVNHYFDTGQVFTLYKPLAADRQLEFRVAGYGVTEPVNMATVYQVSVGLRRYLRKRYLYVELIPQIRYQKIHQFTAEHGVILRLEWVFQG
jgi:hypothetical protein